MQEWHDVKIERVADTWTDFYFNRFSLLTSAVYHGDSWRRRGDPVLIVDENEKRHGKGTTVDTLRPISINILLSSSETARVTDCCDGIGLRFHQFYKRGERAA